MKKQVLAFFLLLLLLLTLKISFSCYIENYNYYNYKFFCSSFRDYEPGKINVNNLTLLTNFSLTNAPDKFIYTYKKGKRQLLGIKIIKNTNAFWTYIYSYDSKNKKFKFIGSFYKGYVEDVNGDKDYEIIYGNPLKNNEINLVNSQIQKKFFIDNKTENWFIFRNYLFDIIGNTTNGNSTITLKVYKLGTNSLYEKYNINFTSKEFQKISGVFVKDNNVYLKYNGDWFLINNNKSKWQVLSGYPRNLNVFVSDYLQNWILNFVDYSLIENSNTDYEPLYSITKFNLLSNGKIKATNILAYSESPDKVKIINLDKKEEITEINATWFGMNKDYFFFVSGNSLYYTNDFHNFHKLYDNVERFYLFDLNGDGKSEILTYSPGNIRVFGEPEKVNVDYYVKSINFPKPYTTYSTYFNFTVCSKGYQIIPFNISVEVYHLKTKLKTYYSFLNQYLDANSCRNYKVNYIPYKQGKINITIRLLVDDSNNKNNIFKFTKDIEHDFYGLIINESGYFFTKNKSKILFIDKDDNLSNGYETINLTLKNCSYLKVDYNSDNATDYLINCSNFDTLYLVDPLNKKVGKAAVLNTKDSYSIVGILNSTDYFVILPWNKYKGYVKPFEKDEYNQNIALVDYNLDGFYDFLVYPVSISYSKQVNDYKIIGQNLRIGNISVLVSDEDDKFIQTISIPIYYKGLFNETYSFPFIVLGENFYLNVSENKPNTIPLSNIPYNDFNLLNLNYEFKKEGFSNNQIKLIDNKDYNKTDNKVNLTICDLKILQLKLSANNSFIRVNNTCLNKSLNYTLIVKSIKNNTFYTVFSQNTNENIVQIPTAVLDRDLLFMVYYKNIIDKDYKNNAKKIYFDLSKLIYIDFLTREIEQYKNATVNIKINCLRNFNLNVSVFCNRKLVKQEELECNGETNFSFSRVFISKDYCYLEVKDEEKGINIKEKIPYELKKAKELRNVKLNGTRFVIIELDGQKYAFDTKNKKLINVCEKEITKNDFSANINLEEGCLNIVKVEVPDYLMVKNVKANGVVIKKGNSFIIYSLGGQITFTTQALKKMNKEEVEKYNIVQTPKEENNMSKVKIFVFLTFLILFLASLAGVAYYFIYYTKKKKQEEKKKEYLQRIYREKLKKEEERRKMLSELVKKKQEKLIEEEAKSLLSWIRFLLNSYDEKEIYNYLLQKGYPKEVVDKAFEIYKSKKG